MEKMRQRYLTTAQAAAYCGYSVRHFEQLRKDGLGPPYSQPNGRKSIRYLVDDLDRWMEQHKILTAESVILA